MIELNKIYEEDCMLTMGRMDDDSVDLIMTSPPYANARKRQYGGSDPDHYIDWLRPIAKECMRVLKPTGSFILNISDITVDGETHLFSFEIPIMMKRELGYKFIDPLVWHKKVCPPGKFKNRFKDAWEFCYHFSKTLDIKFFPKEVAQDSKQSSIDRYRNQKENHVLKPQTDSGFTFTNKNMNRRLRQTDSGVGTNDANLLEVMKALPSNVIHMSPETRNRNHSAAFPVGLPAFFIKAFTEVRDIVYDPFMGSGTTAEAALALCRNFIGSETKSDHVRDANKRIVPFRQNLFIS